MSVELRVLDPTTDIELFKEAYSWRPEPKKHVQTNRVSFEQFASNDPLNLIVGVFTDQLIAVYAFYEYDKHRFDSHFTARKHTSRRLLEWVGRWIIQCFMENGAKELSAWIQKQNRPLRSYVETLGFSITESREFDGKPFIRYSLTAS